MAPKRPSPEGQSELAALDRAPDPVKCTVLEVAGRNLALLEVSLEPPAWPEGLTGTEREIARLLIRGSSVEEIANERNRTTSTVKNQLNGMYGKLHCSGRTQFIARLFRDPDRAGSD
jgi:DNA-binding NarL/FixJ family response regulator